MSSLQAALGQAQLDRIDELVSMKRQIFSWYRDRLKGRADLALNAEPVGTVNSYWMTTVVLDESAAFDKTGLAEALARHGIATRPFFYSLSSLPAYATTAEAARARDANPVGRRLSRLGVNLPSALNLTEDDVDYVCHHLLGVLDAGVRRA
jgi:perosamine synthetase